jgi:hypothetical protein
MARTKSSAATSSSKPFNRRRVAVKIQRDQKPETNVSIEEGSLVHASEPYYFDLEGSGMTEDETIRIYDGTQLYNHKAEHWFFCFYYKWHHHQERGPNGRHRQLSLDHPRVVPVSRLGAHAHLPSAGGRDVSVGVLREHPSLTPQLLLDIGERDTH